MLLTHFIFPQLLQQSTYALYKIKFVTSIKFLHVSAPGCQPWRVFCRTKQYKPNMQI